MHAAPLIEEKLAEVEVAPLTGGPIEFDERQFNFLVTGDIVLLGRPEMGIDEVRIAAGCLE